MTTFKTIRCPDCNRDIEIYANPAPTVDIIIELADSGKRIVLIERKNPPYGWAIPGGFIDYGESAEDAAVREAHEETGLVVELKGILGVYSDPSRDSRQHTISTVFVAEARGLPVAGDDAAGARVIDVENIPSELAFDHGLILSHYIEFRKGGRCLCPCVKG